LSYHHHYLPATSFNLKKKKKNPRLFPQHIFRKTVLPVVSPELVVGTPRAGTVDGTEWVVEQ
jgi:hypothetical protein